MRTVLILDDELFTRRALTRNLELTGTPLNILEGQDGTNVIQTIYEHDVDLVLLDLNMAPADGWNTARIIRSDPRYRDLPIIVISAFISHETRIELQRLGIQHCISKSQLSFTDTQNPIFELITQHYLN